MKFQHLFFLARWAIAQSTVATVIPRESTVPTAIPREKLVWDIILAAVYLS